PSPKRPTVEGASPAAPLSGRLGHPERRTSVASAPSRPPRRTRQRYVRRGGAMDTSEMAAVYQWNYRPQSPPRPAWFTAWPGGARMAVGIIVLHEWESIPRPTRPMPVGAHHTFDFLALGAREYGARHGIWRLLDVLDRRNVNAT